MSTLCIRDGAGNPVLLGASIKSALISDLHGTVTGRMTNPMCPPQASNTMKNLSFNVTVISNGLLVTAHKCDVSRSMGSSADPVFVATPAELGKFVTDTVKAEQARDVAHAAAREVLGQ